MKTELEFGKDYAAFLERDCGEVVNPVNIDEMMTRSQEIPDGDYRAMKQAGIDNPDSRKYWEGYNSYFV